MLQPSTPEAMTSADLVKELTSNATLLFQRQVKLAVMEAKVELSRGRAMVETIAVATLVVTLGVAALLTAAILGLGVALHGRYWLSALIVGVPVASLGVVLLARALSRGRQPLPETRREMNKELTWARFRTT